MATTSLQPCTLFKMYTKYKITEKKKFWTVNDAASAATATDATKNSYVYISSIYMFSSKHATSNLLPFAFALYFRHLNHI